MSLSQGWVLICSSGQRGSRFWRIFPQFWGFWRSFHASWFYDSLKLDYSNKTWVTFQSEGTVIRRANAVATLQWIWIMCNLVKKMRAFKKNKALWMEGCIQRLPNHLHKNTRVWFFLGGKGFPNSILFSVFPTLCLPRSYPMHIHISLTNSTLRFLVS